MKANKYLFCLLLICSINSSSYAEDNNEELESEELMDPMLTKDIDDLNYSGIFENFLLGAIVDDGIDSSCVINGKILSQGDKLADCFVARITKNRVVLINNEIKAIKLTIY